MEWYFCILIYFWLLVSLSYFLKSWSFHISSLMISLFRLVLYFSFGFLMSLSCWYSYLILIFGWLCLTDVANAFSHCLSCLSHFVCSDFWWIDFSCFDARKIIVGASFSLTLYIKIISETCWFFSPVSAIYPCLRPLGQALLQSHLLDNCIISHSHSQLDTMWTLKNMS